MEPGSHTGTNTESHEHHESRGRRPGRPRRFDTIKVLDSALELFWKQGFANTTTRDLESKLSLNQSSIYNAFGSKEQLFEAVLDRYEALSADALLRPLEESKDGIDALERFFINLNDWVTHDGRRGCLLINMMAEDGGCSEAITTRTTAYRERVIMALNCALNRARQLGEISGGGHDSRTMVLFGLALGINIAARGCASNQELTELVGAARAQIQSWRTTVS